MKPVIPFLLFILLVFSIGVISTFLGNTDQGYYNDTYYNSTDSKIYAILGSNGTYFTDIYILDANYTQVNVTADTSSWNGYEVRSTIRANNLSCDDYGFLFFYGFDTNETGNIRNWCDNSTHSVSTTSDVKYVDSSRGNQYKALEFDGTDGKGTISWDSSLNCSAVGEGDAFSFGMWFNQYSYPSDDNRLFSSGDGDAFKANWFNDGQYDLTIYINESDGSANDFCINQGSHSLNQWTHLVVVRNYSGTWIYTDGTLNGSCTEDTGRLDAQQWKSTDFYIGNSRYDSKDYNGTIDEFFFMCDDLSSSQVSDLYTGKANWSEWLPYKDLSNGDDITYFNISNTTNYVQGKFEIRSNTTGSATLNSYNLSGFSTAPDTTPPIISSYQASNIQDTTATVSFSCSETCNYSLSWTGGNINNDTFATSHSYDITGLINNTNYRLNLTVWDSAGNNISNNTYNFTTGLPQYDLFIQWFMYTLPINWTHDNNTLTRGGTMDLNFTVWNDGYSDINGVNYNLSIRGSTVCSSTVNVSANNGTNVTCSWTTSDGFHVGNLTLDYGDAINETLETNNNITIYIPFMDRPWYLFNMTDWKNTLEPYSRDTLNVVAYNSWNWARTFACSAFSDGYTGANVDPYGKKARECALGCFVNNYTDTTTCPRALQHIIGWSNRTLSTYTNVQSIHELVHPMIAYDVMFRNLTEEQNDRITEGFHDICMQITNLSNTRPDEDDDDLIQGDNGKGFADGMGALCHGILGSYKNNPSLMFLQNATYRHADTTKEWRDRQISLLRARKNDSWSKYQEGWAYKMYAENHLVESLWFEDRVGLFNKDSYQSELCAMARETITEITDFNYEGEILRNDQSQYARVIARGDGQSYDYIGRDDFPSFAIMHYYGLLCDLEDVQSSLLWLRNYSYAQDDGTNKYTDMIFFKKLLDEVVTIESPETNNISKFQYDNANDIVTIRTNYTYVNDTIIQIDGGEERGGGHSQAQGYFLYVFGEPALVYTEVPFNDDVREDVWHNGVSLQNVTATQTMEGLNGNYNDELGQYGKNQYYGNNGTAYYSLNWSDYRTFGIGYGGDLEDYVGTNDGKISGVYSYKPMFGGATVKEYFIVFDQMMVKYTIVSEGSETGVYENLISITDEFNVTITGDNMTLNRTRWDDQVVYLDTNLINSNVTFTLSDQDSNVTMCFSKTACTTINKGNSTYRRNYYYSPNNDTELTIAHTWYYQGNQDQPQSIGTTDLGANQSNNMVYFDNDKDGWVNSTLVDATGWGLIHNPLTNKTGAFNTTLIKKGGNDYFTSNESTSVILEKENNTIKMTINSMQPSTWTDASKVINVTINCSDIGDINYTVTKNSAESISFTNSSSLVSFLAFSGQNSDYYTLTAKTAPAAAASTGDSDSPGGGGGGGGSGAASTIVSSDICSDYVNLYQDCFYLNDEGNCIQGCPENQACMINLTCVPSVPPLESYNNLIDYYGSKILSGSPMGGLLLFLLATLLISIFNIKPSGGGKR